MRGDSPFRRDFRWFREAWRLLTAERSQRRVTGVVLLATVLLLVWKYYGTQTFFVAQIGPRIPALAQSDVAMRTCAELYRFGAFAILCGLIPWWIVRFRFREPLVEYGVTLGKTAEQRRDTRWLVAVLMPTFIVIGILSAWVPSLYEEFPFNRYAGDSGTLFAIHVAGYLIFYVTWEFFFRGVLLRTLSVSCGIATAIMVQTALSTIVHLGGPAIETFGAIGGGVLWGLCVWRTGSLMAGLAMHAGMGLALDAAICLLR